MYRFCTFLHIVALLLYMFLAKMRKNYATTGQNFCITCAKHTGVLQMHLPGRHLRKSFADVLHLFFDFCLVCCTFVRSFEKQCATTVQTCAKLFKQHCVLHIIAHSPGRHRCAFCQTCCTSFALSVPLVCMFLRSFANNKCAKQLQQLWKATNHVQNMQNRHAKMCKTCATYPFLDLVAVAAYGPSLSGPNLES